MSFHVGIGATEGRWSAPPGELSSVGLDWISPKAYGTPFGWYTVEVLDLADGDAVSTWPDISGNGRDLTQGSSNLHPTYSISTDGMPYVDFNSDRLGSTVNLTQPLTTFAVVDNHTLSDAGVAGGDGINLVGRRNDRVNVFGGSHVNRGIFPAASWAVVCGVVDGASSECWRNGFQEGTGDAGSGSTTGYAVGAANQSGTEPVIGGIREVIIYPTHLSSNAITSLSRQLMAKWGIGTVHRTE